MRFFALVLVAFTLTGCLSTVARKKNAPKPIERRTTHVTFAPLFDQVTRSNSVYTGKEPGVMKRVLLSPNLVFEASRSSVNEPKTWGPGASTVSADAPNLEDALGEPVDIRLSSALIRYLSASPRESIMLTPAVTKKWDPQFWCMGHKDCVEATWVERLILMQQKPPTKDTSAYAPQLRAEDVPTCAFAVRRLGVAVTETKVIAVRNTTGELEFRPRRSETEVSACANIDKLPVPSVAFQAEIISMHDGRLLARIDESRNPGVGANARKKVFVTRWDPVHRKGWTMYQGKVPYSGEYDYIASWKETSIECESALSAYVAFRDEILKDIHHVAADTVNEVFQCSIGPLYSTAPLPAGSPCAMPPQTQAP